MFGGKLPHEFAHLPLTYFQTLVNSTYTAPSVSPTRNDSGDEDGVELVDVDELIRKGRPGLGIT